MDEFDASGLEISSLRKTTQDGAAEEDGVDTPQTANADGVLVAPHGTFAGTGRAVYWRPIRTVIASICVLSVLALVLARSPETPAMVGNMLGIETPTPTAPLILGMDTIYTMFSVPWGTLRIDGQVQTSLTQTGQDHPIHLSRGRHVLDYHAALFPTLHCTLSVPAADADTCPKLAFASLPFEPVPQDMRGIARVIDLGAKPERLPPDQKAALAAAIDVAARGSKSYQTTVIPGERYALAPDRIAVSSQTLTATLTVKRAQQSGDITRMMPLGGLAPCTDICVDILPANGGTSSWKLDFAASLGWRYTTTDGRIVAETPLSAPEEPMAGVVNMVAEGWVRWEDDHWAVQYAGVNFVNSVCGLANYLISRLYTDRDRITHEAATYGGATSALLTSPQEGDGCYMTYQRSRLDGTQEPEAEFLYRLGMMLAVNGEAQHLFPALPVADTHDRDIVNQMRPPSLP